MDRLRARIRDKRICSLVKAFLKSGVLTELGDREETWTGTPQGGLCSAEHNDPYEQRWVMRSVRGSPLVGAVVTTGHCV
jgi:RNA-directed DNA polymerase